MVLPILAVKNYEASKQFYTNVLGWNLMVEMPGADGVMNFGFVSLGEKGMFGISANDAPEPRGSGVAFMVYVPDEMDIDAYYADVQARGLHVAQPIADQYWGDRSFGFADPDGYFIMVAKTLKQVGMDEILSAHAGQ